MSGLKDIRREPTMITLSDGVEREMIFTLNSFALMEDEYGSIDAAMDAVDKASIKAVRFMLYAGLVEKNPDLTVAQVGSLIPIQDLPAIMDTLNSIIELDTPDKNQSNNSPN